MNERLKFIEESRAGLYTTSELCERYGISRKTGYKWLERYHELGVSGLDDRSHAPHSCPHKLEQRVAVAIVAARKKHPHWGPRKLLDWLRPRHPELDLPVPSTAGELLRREGLSVRGRRRRRWRHPGPPARESYGPNDLWTADFKGQFRTRDGVYCYPLTIADQASRYLLRCQALSSTRTRETRPVMERLFRELGLPRALRTDNGVPFASTGIHGLCALNVWWIRLGIAHQRTQPSHPEQNGAHERMHRTLKAETTRPPATNRRAQQRSFDRFRSEYNDERPHDALGGRAPGTVWSPPSRAYPSRLQAPEYPGHYQVRFVSTAGTFRFQCRQLFISAALKQDWIGLEEIDDGVWAVYFYDVLLARFDERDRKLHA
ncbi:MAG: IS481 family transposase [Thermoanaerobaculia bacterium]